METQGIVHRPSLLKFSIAKYKQTTEQQASKTKLAMVQNIRFQ